MWLDRGSSVYWELSIGRRQSVDLGQRWVPSRARGFAIIEEDTKTESLLIAFIQSNFVAHTFLRFSFIYFFF